MTDRRDAIKLARSLRAGDLSAVHVPSIEDEAFRDLARTWASARDDLRPARQRLKSFLLSHGAHYIGRADWGAGHRRWLSKYSFESALRQLAFDEHRRTIEDRLAQCERLETAPREAVVEWSFYPAVLALQAMRGIQFITAVGMISELGDLSRFEHPRQLMAWLAHHTANGRHNCASGLSRLGVFAANVQRTRTSSTHYTRLKLNALGKERHASPTSSASR